MVQFSYLRAQMKARAPRLPDPPEADLVRALLIPSVFVAMADGQMQPAEKKAFGQIFIQEEAIVHAVVACVDINEIMETLIAEVQHGDPEELMEEVLGTLDAAQRETAIGYALQVAHADGDFDAEENCTLMAMAKNLGVGADQINGLLQRQIMPAPIVGETV